MKQTEEKKMQSSITVSYKGGYIHQNTDGTFTAQFKDNKSDLYFTKEFKSFRACQLFITKNQEYIKRG